jgi:hypothetical protein
MITRFFTSLLLFSLLFVVPFFIWLPLLVLSLLWYPFYVEGLFLALLYDLLFGARETTFFGPMGAITHGLEVFSLTVALLLISLFLHRRLYVR